MVSGTDLFTPSQSKLISFSLGVFILAIAAVDNSKKYIFRYKTKGTSIGSIKSFVRKNGSPYTTLSTKQFGTYSTAIKQQEYLITNATTDAAGVFVWEVQENSGATYFDDFEFYEVTATNIDNSS